MMRLGIAAVALMSFSTHLAAAQAPDREAWDYSISQRLEMRRGAAIQDPDGTTRMKVDGKSHPALLLPHELMRTLLTGLDPDWTRRSAQRDYLLDRIVQYGWGPEQFWRSLEATVDLKAIHDVAETSSCSPEAIALRNARATFGAREFDRFLYEVIAPVNASEWVSAGKSPEQLIEDLRGAATCE